MPVTRHWTTADVRALMREDRAWPRYELIDGELIVTPAPRTPHQVAVGEFHALLHVYLSPGDIGQVMLSPSDLELKAGTITQPDVYVLPAASAVQDESYDWTGATKLLLAIEVLSPSSVRSDRVVKRDLYLANGVAEYWIVDIDARIVERWRPAQETPEILRDAIHWAPARRDPLRIDLPELFNRVESYSRHADGWFRGPGRAFGPKGVSDGDAV